MRQRRKRGSYRSKMVESSWGVRLDILWGRLYIAFHLGHVFRSWWVEW